MGPPGKSSKSQVSCLLGSNLRSALLSCHSAASRINKPLLWLQNNSLSLWPDVDPANLALLTLPSPNLRLLSSPPTSLHSPDHSNCNSLSPISESAFPLSFTAIIWMTKLKSQLFPLVSNLYWESSSQPVYLQTLNFHLQILLMLLQILPFSFYYHWCC